LKPQVAYLILEIILRILALQCSKKVLHKNINPAIFFHLKIAGFCFLKKVVFAVFNSQRKAYICTLKSEQIVC
jgi:hypothetical protein